MDKKKPVKINLTGFPLFLGVKKLQPTANFELLFVKNYTAQRESL